MLKDVVQVCTDGSDLSHKGIESAVEIAKALHLPVVGMTAVLSKPNTVHGLEHEDKAVQERLAAVKNSWRSTVSRWLTVFSMWRTVMTPALL